MLCLYTERGEYKKNSHFCPRHKTIRREVSYPLAGTQYKGFCCGYFPSLLSTICYGVVSTSDKPMSGLLLRLKSKTVIFIK